MSIEHNGKENYIKQEHIGSVKLKKNQVIKNRGKIMEKLLFRKQGIFIGNNANIK